MPYYSKQITYWSISIALLLALAITAAYKTWPLLNPKLTATAPLDSECDLRAGSCSGALPEGGRITLEIEPKSIPVIKPLHFTVRLDGLTGKGVEIDFQGVDMNMGFNRPRLTATDNGIFKGEGMLPVCVRDTMEWEARVLVQTDKGLVAAPFRFITVK